MRRASLLTQLVRRVIGASVAAGVIVVAACSDRPPVAPRAQLAPGHSRLDIKPRFERTAAGGPTVTLTKVRGVLRGVNGDSVVVEATYQPDGTATLTFEVAFQGSSAQYTLDLTGYDKDGNPAYQASQVYTIKPGENTDLPQPTLVYSAPDAKLATMHVSPSSATLNSGVSTGFSVNGANAAGQPISPILVAWASSNSGIATVDANGAVIAGNFQGKAYIVATSVTGLRDSALVTVHAPVAKVVVAPTSLELIRGATGGAAAELRDGGNNLIDDRTATWSSSDASVATVTSSGAIAALKVGSATITASAEGKTGTVAVNVVSPLDHIELTPSSLSFSSLRETQSVTARLVPRAGASVDGIALSLASSNAGVASVDQSGVVTANANGSATITASADGLTASAGVTVKQVAATVSVSPKAATAIALGTSASFSAAVKDARGNDMAAASVAWSSSNTAVATVSGGIATARGQGSASITASVDGKSDAGTFTVTQVPHLIIAAVDHQPIAYGGAPGILTARSFDLTGNLIGSVSPVWTTTTPLIVQINGNQAVPVGNGTASVTATFGSFTSTITFDVTGVPVAPTNLTLSPATAEKLPNGTQQFSVSAGGTGPFTWTVNGVQGGNSTFGTISATGFYTAPAAVPTPSTFDVCAVQASPSATGCSHVTINPVPSAGGEVVVFNDMNLFDNSTGVATGGANQRRFFINLINFTATGPRATKTGFEFFRGHQPRCVSDGECSPSANSSMAQTLTDSGYTVINENDPNATIPTAIDPNVKVLLLLTPTTAFTDAELNSLKQFASEGGRIIFAGEHSGFYGTWIASVENPFFQAMGAQLTNLQVAVNCGPYLVGQAQLRAHQITTGLTDLAVPCAAGIQLGPNDFAIVYDNTGTTIIGAVAKVDLTPISIHTTNTHAPRPARQAVPVPPIAKPNVDGLNRPIRP